MRVVRPIGVVLASLLAATTLAATSEPTARTYNWQLCSKDEAALNVALQEEQLDPVLECAYAEVPLCYPGDCDSDKTIQLLVKRIPATSGSDESDDDASGDLPKSKAIWVFADALGASSVKRKFTPPLSNHRNLSAGTYHQSMYVCFVFDAHRGRNVVQLVRPV